MFTHVPVPEDKWQDMAVIAIVPPAQLASWSQALCDFELKIQAWHGRCMSELHLLVVYFSWNLPSSNTFPDEQKPPPRSGLGIRGTAVLGAECAGREGLGKS